MMTKNKLKKPPVIILTGGVGSGKTTVSNLFSTLGAEIIDTDLIAKSLLQPEQPTFDEAILHFGKQILTVENDIDRKKLREIIFENPIEKKWLENLLHPAIFKIAQEKITHSIAPYILVVIPLFCESKLNWIYDSVLVVDCPETLQLERLMQRDKIDEALAKKILNSQCSREKRLSLADDVILNQGNMDMLKSQVLNLDTIYRGAFR